MKIIFDNDPNISYDILDQKESSLGTVYLTKIVVKINYGN